MAVADWFPNGSTASTCPRVIGKRPGANGYRLAGQKSAALSAGRAGQVGAESAGVRDGELRADHC